MNSVAWLEIVVDTANCGMNCTGGYHGIVTVDCPNWMACACGGGFMCIGCCIVRD